MKSQNYWRSTWGAVVQYVDIETGEKLTEKQVKENYITIKTTKHAKKAKLGSGGIITYTKQCIRNPQRKFKFD